MCDLMKKGDEYKDFEVTDAFELKDYHSTAVKLYHKKLGLEVLHLVNDDKENLFSFSFRTINDNSTGVAHIMEHSVLCGSELYPLKDPFTQLSNQSVTTYLNAFTSPDKTCYPASSTVKADYFNLMSVYADAVFFPRLSRGIFLQEGHRLEKDAEGNYTIQGVVYNEMKGNYSSFEGVAGDISTTSLMEGCVYEKDSGGDPLVIPELTYEQYIDFHKKWYRPDNCFLFLYGNIPTKEQIDFLDRHFIKRLLKKYPDCIVSSKDKKAQVENFLKYLKPLPLREPKFVKAIGPGLEDGGKGNTVLVNFNFGHLADEFEKFEIVVLVSLLSNYDNSPLEKALVESGLGEDTAPQSGLEGLYDTLFTVGLRGVKNENTDKVKDLVFDTLKKVYKEGFKTEDIESIFMATEFLQREVKRNNGPYSLTLMNTAARSWSYGDSLKKAFRSDETIKKIHKMILNDDNYLKGLIKKYFLDNSNWTFCEIKPSNKYTKERDKLEQKIIRKILDSKTEKELEQDTIELKAFQSQKDDPTLIPNLKPADFLRDKKSFYKPFNLKYDRIKGASGTELDLLSSPEAVNGVSYVRVGFALDNLTLEELQWIPLFCKTVTEIGFGDLSWEEAADRVNRLTGGIGAVSYLRPAFQTKNAKKVAKESNYPDHIWLVFNLKVLDDKISDGLELLKEYITNVRFSDIKRIKDIAIEHRNDFVSSIVPAGHSFARRRTLRKNNAISALNEMWYGLSYLFIIRQQCDMKFKDVAARLNSIYQKIREGGSFIHITAEEKTIEKNKKLFSSFAAKTGLKAVQKARPLDFDALIKMTDIPDCEENGQEVFVIPAQIGYAAQATPATPYGEKENAVEEVATHWLSNILLWEKIRTEGGAYGGFCSTEENSGQLLFTSYRDPKPFKSNDVFDDCILQASKITFSEKDVEKAAIGTISDFITPVTPQRSGLASLMSALEALTDEDRMNKRINILKTTPEDLTQTFKNLHKKLNVRKYRVIICGRELVPSGKYKVLPL